MILKIKLKFSVIKILMKELNQSEMLAIYLMGLGQEIPDKVTKFDLIKIIHLLCKKLEWIDEDEEPMEETNEETDGNQAIEASKDNTTNPTIVNNWPQTDVIDCQRKLVKIEGGHQTQSAASDCQQRDDIPRQEVEKINEDKNVSSTTEEILGTDTNIKTKVEDTSGIDRECVDNKETAEGNTPDPQNDEDEFPFSCNLCHQKFSKERFLAAHAYMKHEDTALENEVTFSCSKCDMKFSIREELNTHEITHSENIQYSCSKCEEKFSRVDMLKSHEITHVSDQLGLSASDTIFIDNLIRKLKNNERVYTGNRSFDCKECNKTFPSSQTLRIHERIHTGQKLYHCSKCDYNTTRLQHLQIHESVHTGEKPFSCSYCDYKCRMSGTLKIHVRIHTGEKPFKCPHCDYRCSAPSSLKAHKKIHKGDNSFKTMAGVPRGNEMIHATDHLGLSASDSLFVNNLIKRCKNDVRPYTGEKSLDCKQYNKNFSSSQALTIHEIIHTGEKTYKCSYCDYRCNESAALKMHERSHTGDKPFKCVLCEYRCTSASDLRRHMKTHPGQNPKRLLRKLKTIPGQVNKVGDLNVPTKPFKSIRCSQCDKTFTHNSELWKHKKQTHKDDIQSEKPFKCDICGQTFSFANSCKRHMRTHTKEKPYSCNTCEKKFRFGEELRRHSKKCKVGE